LKAIGNYAFSDCTNLLSVSFESGEITIGNYAFSGCSQLTSVYVRTGCAIATENFGFNAFPEGINGAGGNTLRTAYLAANGGVGIYHRSVNVWIKR